MNGSGMKQVAILVTIGVVTLGAFGGAALAPASAVQIGGFAVVITAQLVSMFNSERNAAKQQTEVTKVANKVEEVGGAVAEKIDVATDDQTGVLTQKLDAVQTGTNAIGNAVNGHTTALLDEITSLKSEVATLKAEIVELKKR